MQSSTLSCPRYRPGPRNLFSSLQAARDFIQWHWNAIKVRRARNLTATLLSDLDDHLLSDIGAPSWARREAAALRETGRRRREHWLRA